jgi:predicted nucleic acid-binding protein
VLRALRRAGATAPQFRRGQKTLGRIGLIPIDTRILGDAALLKPILLRSLDAIHLATALSLGGELAAVVTYDIRLSQAAAAAKLSVWSPGS